MGSSAGAVYRVVLVWMVLRFCCFYNSINLLK